MLSSDDKLAIIALYQSYNATIDAHDASGWALLFTSDGRFVHPSGVYVGEHELAAFVTERAGRLSEASGETQRHWNDGLKFTGDAEAVAGSCDLLVAVRVHDGGATKVIATGRYDDKLAKRAGIWRFAERRLTVG